MLLSINRLILRKNFTVFIVGGRYVIITIRSQHSMNTIKSWWVNIVQAINFSNKEKGGLVQKKEKNVLNLSRCILIN